MKPEIKIVPGEYAGEEKLQVHDREHMDSRARFAMTMIERWGMVQGKPYGEDSAGRQKLSLLEPEEVVERACRMSEIAFDKFAMSGWVTLLPSLDEMEKAVQEEKDKILDGE